MDDKRNDNFGDFFRSRLNDDSQAENQWNLPPDFVFDGAMEKIQREKDKRKRRFLWIFFPLLALLGVGAFGWYALTAIDGVEDRLDKVETYQEQTLSVLPDTKEAGEAVTEVQEKNLQERTEKLVPKSENPVAVGNKEAVNIQNDNPKGSNLNIGKATQRNKPNTLYKSSQDEWSISKNETSAAAPIQKPIGIASNGIAKNTETLKLLENGGLSALEAPLKELPASVEIPRLSKEHKSGYWSLGVYGNLNRASLAMTGIPDSRQNVLTEYDQQYGGYGLGLQSFYHTPGRWSFGTEVGYNCFHNESSLQEQMAYDKDKEKTDAQGLTTYETPLNIGTPLGDYDYAANFRVPGNIQDEATLMNKTAIIQTLHTVHFAGIVRYRLIQKHQWNWYVGGGISADFIFKREHQMRTELYYGSEMMFENDMTVDHLDNETTAFYSAVGETGFEYYLGKKYSLLLQGQYNTSFTNLRDQIDGGSGATYLRDFSVGLCFRMRL